MFVQIVGGPFGWSISRLFGQWMGWLLCGLDGWLFALLTDGFGCFMGWCVACVSPAVVGSMGGLVAWLVCEMVGH